MKSFFFRYFLWLYCFTALLYIFFGWVELQGNSIGTQKFTLGELTAFLLITEPMAFVYFMRKIPPFDKVWRILVIFWMTVLATLIWGYVRDKYFRKRDPK